MPARNIVKNYFEGGYYHVYNRGTEKRLIFLDEQDCHVFLRYIKLYLSPLERVQEMGESEVKLRRFAVLNLEDKVELLCFALMPNHFHLLLKNKSIDGIKIFMQRLTTAYVMYFNKKYKRIGALFQNIYKASPILHDSYLLHLSRYIHNNSVKLISDKINFQDYCSYPYYLGEKSAEWLKSELILSFFENSVKPKDLISSYKSFVEMDISDSVDVLSRNNLLLEDETCVEGSTFVEAT